MRIDVLTLFPGMFAGPFDESIVARARAAGIVDVRIHDLRAWTADRHRTVDDYPYGGGAGMVLKPEPLFAAIESLRAGTAGAAGAPPADATESAAGGAGAAEGEGEGDAEGAHVVLLTPQGEVFRQAVAADLASRRHLVLVCGHYEGVDERVREHAVDREVSVGDYVLSGGELPAMVVVDAVVRLLPGALGSPDSAGDESHSAGLLEYPQYTRPAAFRGWRVPDVLLSGHHAAIDRWRREQAVARTRARRPDLLAGAAAILAADSDAVKEND
ncbi:MAG TPA: tRNA (guanosine(37)-N1)-methyltransferase TrmD [Chloroflexota bacterium]|nr:tRNA (guanosine(37)-N1)-methyltransferase TrmD [Chloroflexota bacterium]